MLEQALGHMRQQAIATTPENIKVWYHYVQADIPQLNQDIDGLLERGKEFSAAISEELYRRYFTEMDDRKMDTLRKALRELIADFSESLQELAAGIGDYDSVLQRSYEALQSARDEQRVEQLIEVLLRESKVALQASSQARHKIDLLSEEITQLKTVMGDLERSALEDALTNTANRRAFDQVFSDYLKLARSSGRGCCLVLVDIDRFKGFNDKFGHQAGDKVLRFVAMILKKMVKGQDFVARHGGEEFAILLPATRYEGGLALARSIVERIAGTRLLVGSNSDTSVSVSVSAGVGFSRAEDTPDTLFARADKCLYEAKQKGRNCVVGEHGL